MLQKLEERLEMPFGEERSKRSVKAVDVCVADERLYSEVGHITRACKADGCSECSRGESRDAAPPGRN